MKPIFVGGCERSGTTLLASLLAGHPDIIAPPEAQFFLDGIAANRRIGGNVSTFAEFVSNDLRFALWGLPKTLPVELAASVSCPAQLMAGLAQAYANQLGNDDVSLWVDHTPVNVGYTSTLLAEFDASSMIHIVRDPRAVVASMRPLDWGASSVRIGARWWLSRLAMGLAAEAVFPGRVVRVHYEELVGETTGTLKRLCPLVGLTFQATMTNSNGTELPAYTQKQHALVGQSIDPTRSDAWRSTLSEREVSVIEGELGDILQILGYEPTGVTPCVPDAISAREFLNGTLQSVLKRFRHRVRTWRKLENATPSALKRLRK